MMGGTVSSSSRRRKCKEISLKISNSLIGVFGCCLLLYSVWMVGVCLLDMKNPHRLIQFPWFVLGCIASGLSLCLISCIGHAAASSSSSEKSTVGCDLCMSCYVVLMFMLLTAETFATAVYLNRGWIKNFPEGKFDEFLDLIKSHIDIFKWVILLVAVAQVVSFLLAVDLTTTVTDSGSTTECQSSYCGSDLPVYVNRLIAPHPDHVLVYDEPRFVSNKWIEY